MKKLLALILCVMLFVAMIPSNAFAWEDKAVSNTAIKEAEKSIKNMYTAIATDELVFGTAKSLHDLFDGLANSLFEGVDSMKLRPINYMHGEVTVYQNALTDNTRILLKNIVGDTIAEYISKRTDVFKSESINGGVDPEKYLKVFVDAVNDAVSSEKAQAGLQAVVYNISLVKTYDTVMEQYKDLNDRIDDWGADKYDEFGFDSNGQLYPNNNVLRDPTEAITNDAIPAFNDTTLVLIDGVNAD